MSQYPVLNKLIEVDKEMIQTENYGIFELFLKLAHMTRKKIHCLLFFESYIIEQLKCSVLFVF